MTSYYKTIHGVKYDRELLEHIEKASKTDGGVSFEEACKIWEHTVDGPAGRGVVTEIEKETLLYGLKTYLWADRASSYVNHKIDPVAYPALSEQETVSEPTPASTHAAPAASMPSSHVAEAREFIVEGAGGVGAPCNGVYSKAGTFNDQSKYKHVTGSAIIYFEKVWKMSDVDDTSGWYYEAPERSDAVYCGQWTTTGYTGGKAYPPPTVRRQSGAKRQRTN
jgi:hypothetical protein